jgi:hypothetical protein
MSHVALRSFLFSAGIIASAVFQPFTTTHCAAQTAADTVKPKGLRVAYASHSLMWDMPPVLAELVAAYGIEGHTIVDHQRIGVSRAIQHWDRPDDQNTAKQALKSGDVDVFVMSPLVHSDEAITKFAQLALENNPNIRMVVQISWPGLGYTDNEQFNQAGGFGGGRGGRGGAPPAGGPPAGDGAQPNRGASLFVNANNFAFAQPAATATEAQPAAGAQPATGGQSSEDGRRGRAGFGGGRGGGFGGGGMFQTPADNKTPEELAKIDAIDIKNAEEQIKKINEEVGKGKTFAYLVPTAQAHNALRTLIYKKEMPGMDDQQMVFIDPIGHPTAPVYTLNAYLHFAVLYQRSPVGLPTPAALKRYNPEKADEMSKKLQELAWELVTNYSQSGVNASAN